MYWVKLIHLLFLWFCYTISLTTDFCYLMNDPLLYNCGGRKKQIYVQTCDTVTVKLFLNIKMKISKKTVRKSLSKTISNNLNTASQTNRGQQENIDFIIIKVQLTISNSTGFQSDPVGNVIILSN